MAATRDIQLPVESLLALRRSLIRQLGSDAGNRALQEAGYAAGDGLFERMAPDSDTLPDTPQETFWDRLGALFRELGWGAVEHESPHPGVGALKARDWFEVEADRRPSCPFTTGVLANILGRAAGGEVAVLQVPCEDGGARCVRFLFGAPAVLDRLYSGLREGQDVGTGMAALG